MPLIGKAGLISKLSPPLDNFLVDQLVDEFTSIERRYILRDWEPAELDGGQFAEILGRILHHIDSGNLDRGRDFADCARYIENDGVVHNVARADAKMLFMVITVLHKFRSKRGAVHISPTYQANHMDARYMVEAVRWAMVETLRIFWCGDREAAATAIRELLRFDVPAVGKFEEVVLVQRIDIRPDEEILILLHYAGEGGFTRRQLGSYAMSPAPRVTEALTHLQSAKMKQVVEVGGGRFVLTDLGQKRIREELAGKLVLE
ncbi:MAG TPA: hypothetical protein VHI52_21120 [Verrucomicrobiae bacterium]|nr:hypothetical protein [Verrucomicrobiae bacterium]